ncbi:hypothetical protein DCO58_01200 [Helicobacter saguini]|uniref:Uncharacterized protein n=1 Tax=Helicobacter saguini TaxID=1548018 RepID=A0A347VZW3_9HELI|nr:DUF3226 domain-containing protein [Helicobacter saguini]MWV62994.1 hypothetical protein [Helicobacter saguini]MWV66337.1 hypothetical protein [Helicobacter saguini]MWV68689.1 hypothetical protein [Helicobacter saguini]MWV71760.1 hypothetical protein [Helicobacter saguini]TLD91545.1 hypothetical protein LS64_011760 [Helicobacter saguini]
MIEKAIKEGKKVKIIFDCDDNFEDSIANINKQLDKEMQEICEIFLLPNNQDCGTLETLYDKIATQKKVLKCFENYKKCIKNLKNNDEKICLPNKKIYDLCIFRIFWQKL